MAQAAIEAMKDGDVVRIDVHDESEHSIFGVIEQTVVVGGR